MTKLQNTNEMSSVVVRTAALAGRILPESVSRWLSRAPFIGSLLRGILNRAVPEGLTEVTIVSGMLCGARMLLDLKSEKYYWLGTYEPMLEKSVADLVRPGMVIYDVGANIGYVTLMMARAVGQTGQVFAFEALPSNVDRIRINIALNDVNRVAQPVPRAVSSNTGSGRFLVHSNSAMGKLMGSYGRNSGYLMEINTDTVRLDDFVFQEKHPSPDVIKMDIEGGGVKALAGMSRVLREIRPICLFELHGLEEGEAALSALHRSRHRVHRMDEQYTRILNCSELQWKEYIVAFPGAYT
jgi:FkbM family methyltransferase